MPDVTNNAPTWWEIQNIPNKLVLELQRRSNTNNIGMSMPSLRTSYNFDVDFKTYTGPMTPWVRVFSNGTGKQANAIVPASRYLYRDGKPKNYNGFILQAGEGFHDAFGYKQSTGLSHANSIIGYEADGNPHYIDINKYRTQYTYRAPGNNRFNQNNETPVMLPPPGVTSVSIKQGKEFLMFSTIKFKCFGLAQLEYLTPFFFSAGMNIFIECGWNLFNQKSLLDLTNRDECWNIISHPRAAYERSHLSNGNYACITGIITKYKFSTVNGFSYDCEVECISRQAPYADWDITTANSATETSKSDITFIDFKSFIKKYLPSINDVIIHPTYSDVNRAESDSNFIDYILLHSDEILNKYNKSDKIKSDADANMEQSTKSGNRDVNAVISKFTRNTFYKGKPEDRIFTGRRQNVYNAGKTPGEKRITKSSATLTPVQPQMASGMYAPSHVTKTDVEYKKTIEYGDVTYDKNHKYKQISYIDENDFDSKDNDEVWLQLDFVFELMNLFCSDKTTQLFYFDISNIIVNAHPNLISCDKNVLIPNPVSPKINKGGRFLDFNHRQHKQNPYVGQIQDIELYGVAPIRDMDATTITPDSTLEDLARIKKERTADKSLLYAASQVRKVFKTTGKLRDNIDSVINYLYYNSKNGNTAGSASFPFSSDVLGYKKYYYGYLKHILISKSKLIEISKNEDIKTLKQFIQSILNVINDSVGEFWKFEIVGGADGPLSIIDKNTINFSNLKDVSMFDVSSTNNVIKSINFDVSLTNEHVLNTLFGSQNASVENKIMSDIQNAKTSDQLKIVKTQTINIPFSAYTDRMNTYQVELMLANKSGSLAVKSNTSTPGSNIQLVDQNPDISRLQIYDDRSSDGVLCMRFKNVDVASGEPEIAPWSSTPPDASEGKLANTYSLRAIVQLFQGVAEQETGIQNYYKYNYKYLNLPSSMKGKLKEMLDDGDIINNVAKYSGVADNFTVEVVFDGIFGFLNLQVFAIHNLPKPYVPGNVIFQILEVNHEISSGSWITKVSALVRCVAFQDINYKLI